MSDTLKKYDTGFTQVSNKILTEPTLSLKAKGIYAYLFSKPDGWKFYLNTIKKEVKEGERAFRSGIKELIDAGYIKKEQNKEKGKFGGNIYTFATLEEINRLAKTSTRQNSYTNNTYIKNNTKEKTQKDKKKVKSQSDNCKTPSGCESGNSNKGGNMPTIDEMVAKGKNKTKESKERIAEKKKERNPVFDKPKNNAALLEKYFYSKHTQEQLNGLFIRKEQDPYIFEASCKKAGITSLEDQKYILDYCFDNWERVRKLVAWYVPIYDIPSLYFLSHYFFLIGLHTNGFGLKFPLQWFRKEDSIEKKG